MAIHDFSTLFDLLPIGAYRSTPDGKMVRLNAALLQLNGYANEAECFADRRVIGVESYVEPGRRQRFIALLEAHGQLSDFVSETYRLKTGERIWVREHAHLVRDAQGQPLYIEGTVEDITQERRATLSLQHSENLLRNLLETIPDRVWLKDLNGVHLACNTAFAANFGATVAGIVGTDDAHWVGEQQAAEFLKTDHLAMQSGKTIAFEGPMPSPLHQDPTLFEVVKAPMRNAQGQTIGVLGMARDIQQRKQAERELLATQAELQATLRAIEHLAFHDTLTGLPNRRMLDDRLETALSASQRNTRHGALLFLDLDQFKTLNDHHGHDVGDLLLQEVARRLLQCIRAIDTVARIGGDEFVVLIQDLSIDAQDARLHAAAVGHKILSSLNAPYVLQGFAHTVTPSIGATLFLGRDLAAPELLRQADQAMYAAKAEGRNTLCFHEKIGL